MKRETSKRNPFAKKFWTLNLIGICGACLADSSSFRTGVSTALGVGVVLAFVSCCFFVLDGVWKYRRGESYGPDLIGLIVSASAMALVTALFTAFGMGGAASTPSF